MFIDLLCLMTGIVGLITTIIAVIRHKGNPLLNKYLIVFLTVISIRFLIRGFSVFLGKLPMENFAFLYVFFVLLMMACTYLYFRDLVFSRKWHYKDSIHLIAPFLVLVLFFLNLQNHFVYDRTIRILYSSLLLLCYATYNFISYRLLFKNIWSKKSDITFLNKQNIAIKNWTMYVYVAIIFLGLMVIVVFISNDFNYNSVGNKYQISFAAILWLLFFSKLLATPELLYGYDFMKIKIETFQKVDVVLNNVWILKRPSEIVNQKDIKITETMMVHLSSYIHQIESYSFHTQVFRIQGLTLQDFAKKLDIPVVHLLYIYKYNCALTFVEYKKMVRIHDAIKLLETDFLKNSTMESLAKEVGFSSYKPFYSGFKSVTGMTPQEYCKKLN